MERDENLQRLMHIVLKEVQDRGGPAFFENLGPRLQRAVLAEGVLRLVYRQDSLISAEKVRDIAVGGWEWANEFTDYP